MGLGKFWPGVRVGRSILNQVPQNMPPFTPIPLTSPSPPTTSEGLSPYNTPPLSVPPPSFFSRGALLLILTLVDERCPSDREGPVLFYEMFLLSSSGLNIPFCYPNSLGEM